MLLQWVLSSFCIQCFILFTIAVGHCRIFWHQPVLMKPRMQDTAEWMAMLQAAQVLYLPLQLPQQHPPMVHSIALQMQELLRGLQVIEGLTTNSMFITPLSL